MYKALYRKYRPSVFRDVVGQEHITTTLKHELATGRLSHAYLFVGSRGTGKTTCAKIFAKAINCPNCTDGDPCGECEICRGIDDGTITDVVEIDAASNNGVDNVRDIRDEVNYTPVKAKYRVYIIDEVHMLSSQAFNALLKTLEEPPEHVKFILATTEANKLPATILSRCQRFDFKHISPEDMLPRLKFAANNEGAKLSDEAGLLIGRLADGAMRDAMSLLDRCISTSNDVDIDTARRVGGVSDKSYLRSIAAAISGKDSESAVRIVNELYNQSVNMESFLGECLNYFRNIMIISSVRDAAGLVKCSSEEFEELRVLAKDFTLPEVIYIIDTLQQAYLSIKDGADRKLTCEMVFIKLTNPLMDNDSDSLLRRLSQLEKSFFEGQALPVAPKCAPAADNKCESEKDNTDSPASGSTEDSTSAPLAGDNDAPPYEPEIVRAPSQPKASSSQRKDENDKQPPKQDSASPLLNWAEVLEKLCSTDFALGKMAGGSRALASGSTLIISGASATFRSMLESNGENAQRVIAAANAVTGKSFTVVRFGEKHKTAAKDPLDELKNFAASSGLEINFK